MPKSKSVRGILFNTNGTYELKTFKTGDISNVFSSKTATIYPHPQRLKASVVAFVDDEGAIRQLPLNDFAWTVMVEDFGFKIGFLGVCGPVVLLGRNEQSLTKAQIDKIQARRKKMDANDDDNDDNDNNNDCCSTDKSSPSPQRQKATKSRGHPYQK